MSKWSLVTKGFVKDNPTFVLVLGMCPTLATTTSDSSEKTSKFASYYKCANNYLFS